MSIENKIKHSLKPDSLHRPHSILARAVLFSLHPGRMILFPFQEWYHRRYKGKYRYERAVFSFDLILVGIIITLTTVALTFFLFPFNHFEDRISFTATVAPRTIVTGAPSTLVIEYRNGTKEPLRNAKLHLKFPDHFLLQGVTANNKDISENNVDLGDVAVGGTGDVHVKGVMFGDVGGKQTFQSSMTFVHGTNDDVAGTKNSSYTFSPEHSTLQLSLSLPDRAINNQTFEGTITYKNTGAIDFPEIGITPEWPNSFHLEKASAKLVNNTFTLPKIRAGESGIMTFSGYLGDAKDHAVFLFHPSFAFGPDHYKQETLTQSIPVLPAQIELSAAYTNVIQPGTDATYTIHYKDIGTEKLHDIELVLSTDSPFIAKKEIIKTKKDFAVLKLLKPGDEGDIAIVIPIKTSVLPSSLSSFQQLQIPIHVSARYALESNPTQRLATNNLDITSNLTTPIHFESFARYVTPSGDQIGRGPLPPRVGQKTSYWIFWNVDGTTNAIDHVGIEGTLPDNVTFTGHQTSSESNGVSFDPDTRKMHWNVSSIPPTLDPASKLFSVAFEVVVNPTTTQIGTSPILVKDIHFTGTDAFTGAFISATGSTITTKLPNDAMVGKKGIVQK